MITYRPGETGEQLLKIHTDKSVRGRLRRFRRAVDSDSVRLSWIQFAGLLVFVTWPYPHPIVALLAFIMFMRSPRYTAYRRRTKR